MAKSRKKKKGVKKVPKKKKETLTFKDVLLAIFFIGGFLFFIIAFASAKMPINDGFILYPVISGIITGPIAGFLINKYIYKDSPIFFGVLFAVMFSLYFTGIVLSLNRPLDRSSVKHNILTVSNKFKMGAGKGEEYYIEVKNFPKKRLEVKKTTYNDLKINGKVDVLTRNGFFHFPYVEDVIPVGLNIENLKKIINSKKLEENK